MLQCVPGLRSLEQEAEDFGDIVRALGSRSTKQPGRWALSNFLRTYNTGQLRGVLRRFNKQEFRRKSLRPVALPFGMATFDGKLTRRKLTEKVNEDVQWVEPDEGESYGLYRTLRVALVSSRVPVVLDEMPVCGKTNETRIFHDLFCDTIAHYDAQIELVSGDAAFGNLPAATLVNNSGKAYLFGLKQNQPTLLEEAKRVLLPRAQEQKAPDAQDGAWERDSRNRRIRRKLWVTQRMAEWLEWSHLRQVFLVRTERLHDDGSISVVDDRYFITNATSGWLTASRALTAIRLHWNIENRVFGTLDRKDLWAEDTTTGWPYKDKALANVSLLRCLAFNVVSLFRGVHLRSEANRHMKWRRLIKWFAIATVALDFANPHNTETEPTTVG